MSYWKGLFTQLRSCAPCWEWCRTNTPPVPEGLPREGQGSLQAPEQQLPAAAWKPVFREDDPARGTTCRGSPHVTLPRRSTATQFSGDSWGHTGTHGGPWPRLRPPPGALMSLLAPHVDNLRSFNGIAPEEGSSLSWQPPTVKQA